jgi:hypothetical protein
MIFNLINFDIDHMEHFHNDNELVAKLGVGRKEREYSFKGSIFTNPSWPGHLFGAQYSLVPKDFDVARHESLLLACFDRHNPQAMFV